jgi:hypothetical protein
VHNDTQSYIDQLSRVIAQATTLLGVRSAHTQQLPQQEQPRQAAMQVVVAQAQPTVGSTALAGASGGGRLAAPVATAAFNTAAVLTARPTAQTSVGGSMSSDAMLKPSTTTSAPSAFLWNNDYYYLVAPPTPLDFDDANAIRNRVTVSMMQHMRSEGVNDYAITNIKFEDVLPASHQDLLAMDPGAYMVAHVEGIDGSGHTSNIPVVINRDGSTYVDPRLRY